MEQKNELKQFLLFVLIVAVIVVSGWLAWSQKNSTAPEPPEFSKVLEEPPVPAEKEPFVVQATARITFDGQSIALVTQTHPSVWFRDESVGRAAEATSLYKNGLLKMGGLSAGSYGIQVTFNDNQTNPVNHPGDYYSWTNFKILGRVPVEFVINAQKVLHMTQPVDNNDTLAGWEEEGCEPRAIVPSGTQTFAWDRLMHGATYHYEIRKIACAYRDLGQVAEGETDELHFISNLAPSEPAEFYLLRLRARHGANRVGILMTWGPNFLAWDYRFRVAR